MTAQDSITIEVFTCSVTAMNAPTGAKESPSPRIIWQSGVNLFV